MILIIELRAQPDYEPEDDEAIQHDEFRDENYLSELARCIHVLFQTCKTNFLPYFDQLLPAINSFLVVAPNTRTAATLDHDSGLYACMTT
jgi:Importin repeat 6